MLRGPSLAFLALSFCTAANAADIGRIENSSGGAVLLREGRVLETQPGTILQLNDVIRTDPGALLRLKLSDGTALMVGEKTELRVALFDSDQQQTLVEMLYGRVRAEVVQYTKATGRFVIKTPTASALALGTTLEVETSAATNTISQKELENLPGINGRPMSQIDTAFTVGNFIKAMPPPSASGQPAPPTSLLDITPGTFTSSSLPLYPNVLQTRVTALDHYVVTDNVNPSVQGLKFLLPGQSATVNRDYGPELGGPIVKDKLWFWGSYGRNTAAANSQSNAQTGSAPLGEFDANGRVCQPGLIMNGEPVLNGGPVPNYQYKILGMGTSTGNALSVSVTNLGTCTLYFFVPSGTIMHPKGFTERVITGLILGSTPNLKDFQKMITFGLFLRIPPAAALGSGPAAPTGGEVTVPMRSFCVELHKLAPHPKTEYKFGDEGDQEKLGVNRPVLERTLQLWQTRQLATDKGHGIDAIIQWSLWAKIEKMDEKEFMDAFMKLVHKNYEAKKQKWDKEAQTKMETSGKDLWQLVQTVLKQVA